MLPRSEIGQVAPGIWLARYPPKDSLDAGYVLMGGQGHNGDEIYEFPYTPQPDPGDASKDSFAWIKTARKCPLKLELLEAMFVLEALKEAGYDQKRHGDTWLWVVDKCGKLIRKFEKKQGKG